MSMISSQAFRGHCVNWFRFDAIRKAREWVASLHAKTPRKMLDMRPAAEPRYPVDELLSPVNPDIRKPFDMREVLLRIVDDSRLSEFKPKYGPNIITAFAHITGTTIIPMFYTLQAYAE